jgi:hypothetical protein
MWVPSRPASALISFLPLGVLPVVATTVSANGSHGENLHQAVPAGTC